MQREYVTDMLKHGSLEDHLGTIERAKRGGNLLVWTGNLRRNAYLRENLQFIDANKLARLSDVDDQEGQATYIRIEWIE